MRFKVASVDSLIIYFGDIISQEISDKTADAYRVLRDSGIEGLKTIIPSYSSILVTYDILQHDFESLCKEIEKEIKKSKQRVYKANSKLLTIEVYYGEEVGIDLNTIAEFHNITIEDVIKIHSSRIYSVFAIGFIPGFAYLAEVDASIATPRLATPRKKVPKGSVAIADTQTAIYPSMSPGGWNIIGRTSFEMFDKNLKNLTPVSVGDKIEFKPIGKSNFLDLGGKI